MATIVEDIQSSSDWIAHALNDSGYCADFTPQSLWEVDRFFDEQSSNGTAKPGGLLSEQLGLRIFALGSYIGEVVRRSLGGEWIGNDEDPEAEITVELHLPGGARCWPVQRVMKRLKNGAEDSVLAWGIGVGLDVGSAPAPVRRGFFKRFFR